MVEIVFNVRGRLVGESNSFSITIPKAIVAALSLKPGEPLKIRVVDKKIIISR